MNNEQFRRLLLDNASKSQNQKQSSQSPKSHDSSRGHGNATPAAAPSLGSRLKSSIPMTPRTVGNIDFARQLSDYHREQHAPPSKRFKSSAAPKGTKLPSGYEDRAAKLRALEEASEGGGGNAGGDDGEKTDLEKRVKALEEMVKLGQIDQATFEKLRGEMGVGGNVGSTHMVKGLDWELLRRVRAGEDVNGPRKEGRKDGGEEEEKGEGEEDVDDAFDRVLEEKGEALPSAPKETEPKKKKKGNLAMAPPAAPTPLPKTRDEILRQLRESRERARSTAMAPPPPPAQPAAPESVLGARFKKVGDDATKVEKKRWVEQDENGRRKEILQITDAQGNTKRKVRWLDKPGQSNGGLLAPDKDAKPLGMEVPVEIASKTTAPDEAEDEDDDIFAGVGADYDPLGDLGEEDSSSSDSEDETSAGDKKIEERASADTDANTDGDTAPPAVEPTEKPSRPRNYFSTSTNDEPEPVDRSNPLTKDPTLLAALKRAAALRQGSPSDEAAEGGDGDEGVDSDTLLRRKKFLEEARRREAQDAMDMDLGFGNSRIEDEEDEEGPTYDEQRGGKKRKRGPKKKKGDKDSVSDVMQVLEGRKK